MVAFARYASNSTTEMKTKKPSFSAKPNASAAEPDEMLANRLLKLALELREVNVYAELPDEMKKAQADLHRAIRKCLQQKRESALDEALELAFEEDVQAYRVLRSQIEEMSNTLLVHRDNAPTIEVNAFVVPLFIHTKGGLRSDDCFQDEQAFEQLRDSIKEGGLESSKANVVLVAHAYHLDELERIGYCHLHAMVQEAMEAMAKKKAPAAEAIALSMSGWPQSGFAPDDSTMELRFLLGFAMKTMDDPFYQVPEKQAAAERYFEARAERFRKWSQKVVPVLKRCLVADGREVQIDFLYQDVFHGGKEAAEQELDMLRVLSEVQQTLDESSAAPGDVSAIIGPMETHDDEVLRISLHASAQGPELGSVEKALSRVEIVENAVADLADALASMGVQNIQLTRRFNAEGVPTALRPYPTH